ncbi:MAG: helix-turn-helix transcriptional regulator [Mesorhizobium sp.]|nr:MAG: helix-turn-helix transcriptional regulator [Mesorhizobium sp.]
MQSDISQANLARSLGISVHQLQKYEHAKNRVSASMLYEIANSLGVPVSRFFEVSRAIRPAVIPRFFQSMSASISLPAPKAAVSSTG